MTVSEFAGVIGARTVSGDEAALSRKIEGCYAGDLLSRVISRAVPAGIWITIMSNVNVAAVALLADVACIVLCEDVQPDEELKERAASENIPLILSGLDAYTIITKYNDALR